MGSLRGNVAVCRDPVGVETDYQEYGQAMLFLVSLARLARFRLWAA